jgi:mannose-1-phosphate guanylyltransferase
LTNREQTNIVREKLSGLKVNVVAEPTARNTAPAILWICNKINEINPNATIVVLPADHFIPEKEKFNQTINRAIKFAHESSKIITIGIVPAKPATGYGYIQVDDSLFNVIKFHEKPTLEKAQEYIKNPNMFWNAGMFIAKAQTLLNEFTIHAPKLSEDMFKFFQGSFDYAKFENISIDYAIMEKSSNIALIPSNFEWHDVGNLMEFLNLKQRFEPNSIQTINFQGHNNITNSTKKLVVCVGVSELCIIETEGVLLIAKNDSVEQVKNVLPKIKPLHEKLL